MSRPVALVTGASRGLGRAIARALADDGCDVGLVARSAEALDEVAAELRQLGGRVSVAIADVRDPRQVEDAVAQTVRRLGVVDVLVNNAGIAQPLAAVAVVDPTAWLRTVETNLGGPLLLTRAVLPSMLARGLGVVINVASILARKPTPGFSAYAASKAGLEQFTRVLAAELAGTGVRTHVVYPGVTDTAMIAEINAAPEGTFPPRVVEHLRANSEPARIHRPDEPARAIAWLASERGADWMDVLMDFDDPRAWEASGVRPASAS